MVNTTIAITRNTRMELLKIKTSLERETGEIHSFGRVIDILAKQYNSDLGKGGKSTT